MCRLDAELSHSQLIRDSVFRNSRLEEDRYGPDPVSDLLDRANRGHAQGSVLAPGIELADVGLGKTIASDP